MKFRLSNAKARRLPGISSIMAVKTDKRTGQKLFRALQKQWPNNGVDRMITCCLNCTSRHQACHDTCEKYKAEKKDFEERKAFVYELNHSQSVYHRDYEDKHRERGKKRYLGSEFRGERG